MEDVQRRVKTRKVGESLDKAKKKLEFTSGTLGVAIGSCLMDKNVEAKLGILCLQSKWTRGGNRR